MSYAALLRLSSFLRTTIDGMALAADQCAPSPPKNEVKVFCEKLSIPIGGRPAVASREERVRDAPRVVVELQRERVLTFNALSLCVCASQESGAVNAPLPFICAVWPRESRAGVLRKSCCLVEATATAACIQTSGMIEKCITRSPRPGKCIRRKKKRDESGSENAACRLPFRPPNYVHTERERDWRGESLLQRRRISQEKSSRIKFRFGLLRFQCTVVVHRQGPVTRDNIIVFTDVCTNSLVWSRAEFCCTFNFVLITYACSYLFLQA